MKVKRLNENTEVKLNSNGTRDIVTDTASNLRDAVDGNSRTLINPVQSDAISSSKKNRDNYKKTIHELNSRAVTVPAVKNPKIKTKNIFTRMDGFNESVNNKGVAMRRFILDEGVDFGYTQKELQNFPEMRELIKRYNEIKSDPELSEYERKNQLNQLQRDVMNLEDERYDRHESNYDKANLVWNFVNDRMFMDANNLAVKKFPYDGLMVSSLDPTYGTDNKTVYRLTNGTRYGSESAIKSAPGCNIGDYDVAVIIPTVEDAELARRVAQTIGTVCDVYELPKYVVTKYTISVGTRESYVPDELYVAVVRMDRRLADSNIKYRLSELEDDGFEDDTEYDFEDDED